MIHTARLIVASVMLFALKALGADMPDSKPLDLASLSREPETWNEVAIADNKATLASDKWAFLLVSDAQADAELAATITILEPARNLRYFGEAWSVWPDATYGDGGFEAGLLVRGGKDTGYRVQLSHKYQEVSLIKYPDGGYLQSVPCEVKLQNPQRVAVSFSGNEIVINVDGVEKIR